MQIDLKNVVGSEHDHRKRGNQRTLPRRRALGVPPKEREGSCVPLSNTTLRLLSRYAEIEPTGNADGQVVVTAFPDNLGWPQIAPDSLRWLQMAPDGLRWPRMVPDGSDGLRSPQMAPDGPRRPQMALDGSRWPHIAADSLRWLQLAPNAVRWLQNRETILQCGYRVLVRVL